MPSCIIFNRLILVWACFWALFGSIYLYVCFCQQCSVLITVALRYSLKSGTMLFQALLFLKIALAI